MDDMIEFDKVFYLIKLKEDGPVANFLVSNSMLMLEKAMNFQWTKQSVLNNNVTNADTPDYKAKYVTFEEALRGSIRNASLSDQPRASMRSAISASSPTVHTTDDETFRMDGSSVNVAEQMLELTRNAYQLNFTFRAISSDMSRLLTAIRGQ